LFLKRSTLGSTKTEQEEEEEEEEEEHHFEHRLVASSTGKRLISV